MFRLCVYHAQMVGSESCLEGGESHFCFICSWLEVQVTFCLIIGNKCKQKMRVGEGCCKSSHSCCYLFRTCLFFGVYLVCCKSQYYFLLHSKSKLTNCVCSSLTTQLKSINQILLRAAQASQFVWFFNVLGSVILFCYIHSFTFDSYLDLCTLNLSIFEDHFP